MKRHSVSMVVIPGAFILIIVYLAGSFVIRHITHSHKAVDYLDFMNMPCDEKLLGKNKPRG